MSKEKRLGRGLEALLGRPATELGAAPQPPSGAALPGNALAGDALLRLNVYEIESNPFQPRRDFDPAAIEEMAESLEQHGLLQPLVVRRQDNRYQLIAGERRLRAAIKAGWSQVAVRLLEADDRQMAEMAIVENLQRKDLNPLEKAASFQQYLDRYRCTQEDLAGRLKIDRSTIANLIRLLELPTAVQDAIRNGAISQGHARALLPLDDEREQLVYCQRIQDEALSVRAIEEMVQDVLHQADAQPAIAGTVSAAKRGRGSRARSGQLAALEQELRTLLGTKVDVRQTATGRGRIVVHFANSAEFERLRQHLAGHRPETQVG